MRSNVNFERCARHQRTSMTSDSAVHCISINFTRMLAFLLFTATPTQSDTLCPEGRLNEFFNIHGMWDQFSAQQSEHVAGLHNRLSRFTDEAMAAWIPGERRRRTHVLGRQRTIIMQQMFVEGVIAATDVLNAYCVVVKDTEPWTAEIRNERRAAWGAEWPKAHFCGQ